MTLITGSFVSDIKLVGLIFVCLIEQNGAATPPTGLF